jgi:ParB-like chromosome segregation protein Spo0J
VASWPADRVERRKVSDLVPYARNARLHSEDQVAQIAASIKEWGWTAPVLIDEAGGIIAGHGRVMAAKALGIEEVPTVTAIGWTTEQKQAYVIADNQIPQTAEWDMDLLRLEMEDLTGSGFDMDVIGFDALGLETLLDSDIKETSTLEIDPDSYELAAKCPKCGFEYNEK